MTSLTEDGRKVVAEVAARHGVSADAVTHLLLALAAGQGSQAQFNHPELGGMGQWSLGGMTMVGDMFNNGLKAKVDGVCSDLSDILRTDGAFVALRSHQSQSQSQGGGQGAVGVSLFVPSSREWPAELGQPASVGSQNDMRYAWFPDKRRLAIDVGGRIAVHDTGDHQIGGFGQAQSGGQSLTFTSQHGLVRVADLPVVEVGAEVAPRPVAEPAAAPAPAPASAPGPLTPPPAAVAPAPFPEAMSDDQIFNRIERLADLFEKGILSQAEYEAKKAELLARL